MWCNMPIPQDPVPMITVRSLFDCCRVRKRPRKRQRTSFRRMADRLLKSATMKKEECSSSVWGSGFRERTPGTPSPICKPTCARPKLCTFRLQPLNWREGKQPPGKSREAEAGQREGVGFGGVSLAACANSCSTIKS